MRIGADGRGVSGSGSSVRVWRSDSGRGILCIVGGRGRLGSYFCFSVKVRLGHNFCIRVEVRLGRYFRFYHKVRLGHYFAQARAKFRFFGKSQARAKFPSSVLGRFQIS